MKKILAISLLLPSLSILGCNTTAANKIANSDSYDKAASDTYITENTIITDSNEALNKLKDGNTRFLNDKSKLINVTSERRSQLIDNQNPYAVIVSCSDSRVTPTTVFDCGLGEIFDIRLAGNILDTYALGSIEYGVEHLHSPLLVIMGHEKCGAVTAAYDKLKNGTEVHGNISAIVDEILPHIKDSDDLNDAIEENIDAVYEEVQENEIVKNLVNKGKLKVVKAYYSLDGRVEFEK